MSEPSPYKEVGLSPFLAARHKPRRTNALGLNGNVSLSLKERRRMSKAGRRAKQCPMPECSRLVPVGEKFCGYHDYRDPRRRVRLCR